MVMSESGQCAGIEAERLSRQPAANKRPASSRNAIRFSMVRNLNSNLFPFGKK